MNSFKKVGSVAFIGLGTMGYPMAGHLARSGFKVRVFNRTANKAQQWVSEFGGAYFESPADAAESADVVCLCVGNDDDVRQVMFGKKGAISSLKSGAIVIDHTTTSAQLAIELAQACKDSSADFMDAPVSGGQAGAESGQLTAMCGACSDTYQAVTPILEAYCSNTQLIGDVGQGQRCKMVNQICIAGVLEGLGEALKLAQANNLPIGKVVDALKSGAAGSWQLANRLQSMNDNEFNFGFALDWMIKDLGICLSEASERQIDLPMTKNVSDKYKILSAQGKGRFDTSALCLANNTVISEG